VNPTIDGRRSHALTITNGTIMSKRLQYKRALVTAAASGIGRETALAFAREGAQVLAVDINPERLAALAAEGVERRLLDVTDRAAISAIFGEREFDVVFNCAGWVHQGSIQECDESDWSRSFAVNVDSMFWICRSAIPQMLKAGSGSIINMSSVASSIKGAQNRFAYGATKAAVIGLTKSIAADYASRNIRCNAICPGTVLTPSLEDRVAALGGSPDEIWSRFFSRQPMGRLGKAAEIASMAVYLASDEGAFATGATFVLDGGWSN
jgi:2-keto-3-deoxy-L-fuconate dehydrogenase